MTSVTTRPRNLNETNSVNAGPKAPAILHTAGTPHERLLFVVASLVGKVVTVQTKDGKEYEGILQACMTEKEMGVIIALARQKVAPDDPAPKPINEMVFLAKDYLQVTASDMDLFETETGAARKNKGEVLADVEIEVAGRSAAGQDRELLRATAWLGDGTTQEELTSAGGAGGQWDQFARNEAQFGKVSTYNEEMYTTKLSNKKFTEEQLRNAERMAREIESKPATSAHVAEERGQSALQDDDMDEEDKYSTVLRPGTGHELQGQGGGKPLAWARPQPPAAPAAPAAPVTSTVLKAPSTLKATAREFVPNFGAKAFAPASPAAPAPGYGAAPAYGSPQQPMTPQQQQQQMQQQQMQMQQQQQQMYAQAQQMQMMGMPPQMQMMMPNGARPMIGPNGQMMMVTPQQMSPQQMQMMAPQAFPHGSPARPIMQQRPPQGPRTSQQGNMPPPQQGNMPPQPQQGDYPSQMPPGGAPPPAYQ